MKYRSLLICLSLSFMGALPGYTLGVATIDIEPGSQVNATKISTAESKLNVRSVIELQSFVRGSMEQIRALRKDSAFVLILWSIDCPACYEELTMWRKVKERYPDLDVVLISTDPTELKDDVQRVVKKMGVSTLELWQFADAYADPLRYEIDPRWSGELPRTYFYSATGEYIGRSGIIKQEKIEAWIEGALFKGALKNHRLSLYSLLPWCCVAMKAAAFNSVV